MNKHGLKKLIIALVLVMSNILFCVPSLYAEESTAQPQQENAELNMNVNDLPTAENADVFPRMVLSSQVDENASNIHLKFENVSEMNSSYTYRLLITDTTSNAIIKTIDNININSEHDFVEDVTLTNLTFSLEVQKDSTYEVCSYSMFSREPVAQNSDNALADKNVSQFNSLQAQSSSGFQYRSYYYDFGAPTFNIYTRSYTINTTRLSDGYTKFDVSITGRMNYWDTSRYFNASVRTDNAAFMISHPDFTSVPYGALNPSGSTNPGDYLSFSGTGYKIMPSNFTGNVNLYFFYSVTVNYREYYDPYNYTMSLSCYEDAIPFTTFIQPSSFFQARSYDASSGAGLSSTFGIYSGYSLMKTVSTSYGSSSAYELPAGTYTLRCLSVPSGYNTPSDVSFTVSSTSTASYPSIATMYFTRKAPTSISVSPSSATIKPTETKQLTATVSPSDVVDKTVTWTSSNASVATVNANGLVTAVGNGTAVITARTNNGGLTATSTITVTTPVTSITLSPATASIKPGETSQLTATILPATATDKTVTWTTSDASIATVNANGLVTAVAPGTATITVRTNSGGFTATSVITVTTPVTGVTLSPATASIKPGETSQLTATILPATATDKTVSWTTSDASIATVNASGLVTAVAPGTATITVRTNDGGFTATSVITVKTPVTGISVTPETVSVKKGATTDLVATVTPADATNKTVTWSSSDTSIATVDANGKVTAKALGTATITVITADGAFTDTSVVTVTTVNDKGDSNLCLPEFRESESASNTWYNSTTYAASKALDGNFGTRWATMDNNYLPVTLTVNFKDIYTINEVYINETNNRTGSYTMEYLKPGTVDEWISFHTGTTLGTTNKHVYINSFGDIQTKSVRITLSRMTGAPSGITLNEFQVRYK